MDQNFSILSKSQIVWVVFTILLLLGGLFFFSHQATATKEKNAQNSTPTTSTTNMNQGDNALSGEKVLFVIAFKDFRDEEYFIPKNFLEKYGAVTETVSTQIGRAIGADGGDVEIAKTVVDVTADSYDAVIFIGGNGMVANFDNVDMQRLAKTAVSKEKLVGAICIAPVILAKAGVLEGKRATVWSSILDKNAIKILKESGATYVSNSVVQDGRIITGNGPSASQEFAQTIKNNLE